MIEKIISGGETATERAALDAAIELGIPHGGWISEGRMMEDGSAPDRYQLKALTTSGSTDIIEQNVMNSDGTLVISHGKLTDESTVPEKMATKHDRAYLHIDLAVIRGFSAAQIIKSWVLRNKVKTLYITGPRATKVPEMHDDTVRMLKAVYYLFFIEHKEHQVSKPLYPRTVDAAVDRLISEVPLKDKVLIAKMNTDELHLLDTTLGAYIRDRYGLRLKRGELMKDCQYLAKNRDLDPEQASHLIIEAFWEQVRETHLLRVVKK
ncbi:MAG: hypothetical protein JRL30_08595 [Deltaproteobacteria bacterium]|nr:hypothetical protein [Deltaproteobacteria bacterium]